MPFGEPRNDEILARFERGESIAEISASTQISEYWVKQSLAEARRRKFVDWAALKGLSNRSANALVGAGFKSAEQISSLTRQRLVSEIDGLGKISVAEVEAWLSERGLQLQPEKNKREVKPREYVPPKTIPAAIRFLERHGYKVIPPDADNFQ